jgi:hypothetical protein
VLAITEVAQHVAGERGVRPPEDVLAVRRVHPARMARSGDRRCPL